jgi:transposase
MTLANMRRQGVHHLIAFCLNDGCRHQALIEVELPSGRSVRGSRFETNCNNL